MRLLLLKDASIAAIATDGRYLAWETGPSRANSKSALMQRDQASGKVRTLASGTAPAYGLASTRTHLVYARLVDSSVELLAVGHDGRDRLVLTRSLAAPVASRGDMVAWAEQSGASQRIVVRHMQTSREWVAARVPRCKRGRCYRIDGVNLADGGVVFDRGAIGAQPSFIVRRGFRDSTPSTAAVPKDPQPDLARSSAGALYYWLQHGWMRWDFGQKRPRVQDVGGARLWALSYEHGRLLTVESVRCRPRLLIQLPSGRRLVMPAPESTPASPRGFGPLCRLLTGFAWRGRQLLVAWSVIPQLSLRAHTTVGQVGVVTAIALP